MLEIPLFLAAFAALLTAPLVPALQELRKPTDATPLDVHHGNAADATEALHAGINAYLAGLAAGESAEAMIKRRLGLVGLEVLPAGPVSLNPLVHTRTALGVGPLAVMGECLTLGALWAPSLVVAEKAVFAGKLSAQSTIELRDQCEIKGAQAPRVTTGATPASGLRERTDLLALTPVGSEWLVRQQRFQAKGTFHVTDNTRTLGLIIGTSSGVVGKNARVAGSIRCHGHLVIKDGAVVEGNVVADDVTIGRDCIIDGCVIALRRATVGRRSVVGGQTSPASVVATDILLGENVTVYGAVVSHRHTEVKYDL